MKVGYRKNKFSEFPIVKGRERVLVIGADERRTSLFAIVELDSIIASHNEKSFGTSKDYPLDDKGNNVNDRNYENDKNAQAKVKSVAQNLEPNMLISTSVNPSGTPIISIDGIVVSGNNRAMSLKLAKSDYPNKYKEYLDALMKEINYGGYGINYDKIFGDFKNPVLVRIDKDFKEYNSAELNKYNVSRYKSEKAIDKSVRISKLLQNNEGCKNKLIDLINEQEVVSELYKNISSVARFKSILLECELINENDISALFSKGTLSEQGKLIYRTILLSLVLNEDSLEISQSDGIKVFTKNVVNAILPLIKNKSLSKGSLIGFVNDSFLIQNDLVNGGFKHLNDYIKQSKLGFEEESDEFKNQKALIINEVVNSGFSKLKNTLIRYNNSMEKNIEPDIFGEQLGEQEIFDKTFGVEVDEKTINLISKTEMKKEPKTDKDKYEQFVNENINKTFLDSRYEKFYILKSIKTNKYNEFEKDIIVDEISKKGEKKLNQEIDLTYFGYHYDNKQIGKFANELYVKNLVKNYEKENKETKKELEMVENIGKYYDETNSYYTRKQIDAIEKKYGLNSQKYSAITLPKNFNWKNADRVDATDPFYLESNGNELLTKRGLSKEKYGLSMDSAFGNNSKPLVDAYALDDEGYFQLLYIYERNLKTQPSSEKQQLEESFKQRIKVGNRYENWTITQYNPIRFDDLGGVNDGYLKLVNQENFEVIEILNDNALKNNSWFTRSIKGLRVEDSNLKNALKNSLLAFSKKKPKQNIIDKKIKVLKLLLGTKQGKFGGNKEIIEKKIKVLELINK